MEEGIKCETVFECASENFMALTLKRNVQVLSAVFNYMTIVLDLVTIKKEFKSTIMEQIIVIV